jgi:hypothetical protein
MPWGVAAAAVVSAGAGMYDTSQQISAQKSAIAPLQQAQQQEYGAAESIANTPYTAYTGTQVAPITGSQQQAITQAQTDANTDEAGQDIGQSEALAGQIAGNSWNSATAAKYMNPYTQNVTDVAQKQMQQQYAQTINAQNLGAASTGAFGGDRSTLTNENTTGQYLYQSGNLAAVNQANAYNSAVQTWQADNQRASSAASAYQSAGNDITQMNASQIKDLLATGGVAQATQQMQLNANYNDYLDQRGWAANELQPLIQATGGKGTPANPTPMNTASDLAGLGSALAGYYGSSTGSVQGTENAGVDYGNNATTAGAISSTAPSADSGTISGIASNGEFAGGVDLGSYCDRRMKEVGPRLYFDPPTGLPVHVFTYKGDPQHAEHLGFMADEVLKKYPEAVSTGPRGFLMLDPAKIPSGQRYPHRVNRGR